MCETCDADASNDCVQDCAGTWGGTSENDECGVCGGDNSSCADCAGVPNGDNVEDMCETCDADASNDCVQDCAGTWGGTSENDECGVCGGDNSSCADCAGVPNGDNVEDMCETCDADASNDCVQDCSGEWGGSSVVDECGVCGGNNSSCGDSPFEFNQSTQQAAYFFVSVTLYGNPVEADDWVGAFCNDICVGGRQWDTSLCGGGVCDILAMGYDAMNAEETAGYCTSGDIVTFKIYDASENEYYDAIPSEEFLWSGTAFNFIDNLSADLPVSGCTDMEACNYDEAATVDDGSCLENDCAGECGGDAAEDNCGTCDNDPNNDCPNDCNGEPGGNATEDNCGTCDNDPANDCVQDCNGDWGGSLVNDECGVCGGDNSSCEDCAGVPNGDAVVDNCGTCDDDNSNDCVQDCSGEWGGSSVVDECGVCGGNNSSCGDSPFEFNQSTQQAAYFFVSVTLYGNPVEADDWVGAFCNDICVGGRQWDTSLCGGGVCDILAMGYDAMNAEETAGYCTSGDIVTFKIYDASENEYYDAIPSEEFLWSGTAFNFIDNLSADLPVSGCTDMEACNYDEAATVDDGSCLENDCAGECGGDAAEDNCGTCDNDPNNDCPNDCNGEPGGNATEDNCGTCDNDPANDCVQDCNGDWGGSLVNDECGVCGGDNSSCEDCAGVPNGDAVVDNCGTCDDDNSNDCVQDCSGEWGGSSVVDECGVCGGNNSSCGDSPFEFNQSTQQAAYFFVSVTLYGNPVEADDWVGAFCNDICVGGRQWDTSLCGGGVCDILAMGYDAMNAEETAGYCTSGDIVTFKIYDASENEYYDAIPSEEFLWSGTAFNFIDNLSADLSRLRLF